MTESQRPIVLSALAHVKILLHAAQNPCCPVHGILVGEENGQESIYICDVLPVCHSSPTKPVLDMGLRLAEVHLKGEKRFFAGWYTSNERLDDMEIKTSAYRIMDAIYEKEDHSTDLVLAFLSGTGFASVIKGPIESNESGLNWFGRDEKANNWSREISNDLISAEKNTVQILDTAENISLFDFEHHLACDMNEMKEIDWLRNPSISFNVKNI